MKLPTTILAVVAASTLAFLAGRASTASLDPASSAGDPAVRIAAFQPEDEAPVPPEMQAMFEAGMPTEEHEVLARFVGQWHADMAMSMPDGSQMRSTAALHGMSMFEGRFVGQEMSGNLFGRPFEGYALYGYSRSSGEYQAIWFDSMSTHIYMSRGQYDAENDRLVLHGQEPDPTSGALIDYRDEIEFLRDDEHTFTRYYTAPDGEFQGFQVRYTRE